MDHQVEEDQPYIRSVFVVVAVCVCLISCAQSSADRTHQQDSAIFNGEAISFLNDTLQRPIDDGETFHLKDSLLQEAATAYEADSNDLDNIIWMGRRLAYLHRYKDAIDIYSRGIEVHPDAPQLYRHRGHRYITVRRIDDAIRDLNKGISLAENKGRETEADGIPNKLNIPLSNLHFNLFYHLGLAYFLKADYKNAIEAYSDCLRYSDNPDLKVATADWLYLAYQRAGDSLAARQLLASIHTNMEIIENEDYLLRLLLYKGEKDPGSFADSISSPLVFATQYYGVSCWHEFKGHKAEAARLRERILASGFWPAFGFIAAEADSARLRKNSY
jgi:tetratricopeptide (TPR) repeat protein